jgi:hypothetical protein
MTHNKWRHRQCSASRTDTRVCTIHHFAAIVPGSGCLVIAYVSRTALRRHRDRSDRSIHV